MAEYTIDKFSYGGNTYNLEDSNILIVHITTSSDYSNASADKTLGEIYSAYQLGKSVVAFLDGGNGVYFLTLDSVSNTECFFVGQMPYSYWDNSSSKLFLGGTTSYYAECRLEDSSEIWTVASDSAPLVIRNKIYSAICTDASGVTAKKAILDDVSSAGNDFSLQSGVRVAVRFSNGNGVMTPTLNVGNTGAKDIVFPTGIAAVTSGNGTTYNTWGPYETIIFTYNGSQWVSSGSALSIYNAYALANSKGTGTITGVSVNGTSVATSGVANITSVPSSIVSGLGAAASKAVDTTIADNSTSTNLPTSAAVATYVANHSATIQFKDWTED